MPPQTNTHTTTPESHEGTAGAERPLAPRLRLSKSRTYIKDTVETAVLKSDDYFRLRSIGKTDAEAFPEAAQMLAESPEELDDFDRSVLSIASHLGVYVEAEQELHEIREVHGRYGRKSRAIHERMNELKENHIIPFNQKMKELLNDNPSLNINDLAHNFAVAYSSLYSGYNNLHPEQPRTEQRPMEYDRIVDNLHMLIDGMRHELAAETMLIAAGLPYKHTVTAEQDRMGRDLFVELDGHWIGVDVKASLTAEHNSHQKIEYSKATWTGLYPEDFLGTKGDAPGSVSISFDTAKKKSGAFIERLRRMQNGNLSTEHSRMRNAGSHALRAARH